MTVNFYRDEVLGVSFTSFPTHETKDQASALLSESEFIQETYTGRRTFDRIAGADLKNVTVFLWEAPGTILSISIRSSYDAGEYRQIIGIYNDRVVWKTMKR